MISAKSKPQVVLDGMIVTIGSFLVALGAEKDKPVCSIRVYCEFLERFGK